MSGEEITFYCQRCRTPFVGIKRGYFVTGIVDGVFCSVRCLGVWAEAYLENVERAMSALHAEYEQGGSG